MFYALWKPILVRTLILLAAAALAAGCGEKRSEQYRLEGDTYLKLKRIDDAETSYKKAMAANPANAAAHLGLGKCCDERSDFAGAIEAYRAAIELDPALSEAYMRAGTVLLRQDTPDVDGALGLAEQLEAAAPEQGGSMRAFVLRSAGRLDEAINVLEAQRGRFPESTDTRLALATAYIALNAPAKAETELRHILTELDPELAAARFYLIEACRMQGKTDEMVTEFEELLKANPGSPELKEGLARSLLYAGRHAEAETSAAELIEQDQESLWGNYVLGAALLARGEMERAITHLETAVRNVPPDSPAMRDEIDAQLRLARTGAAKAVPPVIRPAAADGRQSDWQTLWRKAELWELVERRDEFLAADEPLLRETLLLAAVFLGDFDTGRDLAAGLEAESPYLTFLDVLTAKDFEQLTALFEDWNEVPDDDQRNILRGNALGYALGRGGLRGRALQVLQGCYKVWPENVVCLYNLAAMFRVSGQPRFAARTLQRLLQRYSGNLDVQLMQYDTMREGGLLREARNIASTTYVQFPRSPEAILNFAAALLDGQEPGLALTLLNKAQGNLPGDTDILAALASVHLRLGDTETSEAVLNAVQSPATLKIVSLKALQAAAREDWSAVAAAADVLPKTEQSLGLVLLLAAAHGKAGGADAAFQQLASLRTDHTFWNFSAGKSIRAAFDLPGAESDALGTALKGVPEARWDFLMGTACEALGQPSLAANAYLSLESHLPAEHRIAETILRTLARSLNREESLAAARALAERHADSAAIHLAHAKLLYADEDMDGAGVALERAIEADPNDARVWVKQGEFLERRGDLPGALAAYRRVVEIAPEDMVGNNNLAYLLLRTKGDVNEALDHALRAKEQLKRSSADILHTLGLAQLEAGLLGDSAKTLQLAIELRPGDPTIMLDYGRLKIAQGEKDAGLNLVKRAVLYSKSLGLAFPRLSEAEAIIEPEDAGGDGGALRRPPVTPPPPR